MKNFLSCDDLRRGGGDEIHVPGCVFGLFGQGSHSVTRQCVTGVVTAGCEDSRDLI